MHVHSTLRPSELIVAMASATDVRSHIGDDKDDRTDARTAQRTTSAMAIIRRCRRNRSARSVLGVAHQPTPVIACFIARSALSEYIENDDWGLTATSPSRFHIWQCTRLRSAKRLCTACMEKWNFRRTSAGRQCSSSISQRRPLQHNSR
jgi:hypothetical protein